MTVQNSKLNILQNYILLATLFLLPVYLIKLRIGLISLNILEVLIAVLFLVWVSNKQKKYIIHNTLYIIPTLFILAGLALSMFANHNYYSGLGVVKGWFVFPIIFSVIFYDALKKDGNLLKKAMLSLFFSGVTVSIVGIVFEITGTMTYDGRLKVFWDSPNQLAMFLAPIFLVGTFFVSREKKKKNLAVYFFGFLLVGLNLYFAKSFGAWLGIFVALLVIFWLKYNKNIPKKYWAIGLAIILVLFAWFGSAKYGQITRLGERSSLASRAMIWKSSGLMIKNNPLLGIGPGNFQDKYLEYQKYFPPYLEWSAPHPHNIFLAFWLQSGLVGLAGFVWLVVLFFWDNKTAIKCNRDLGILFLAAMVYVLAHGLVDTTYWRNDLALTFWVLIAGNLYLSTKKEAG